MTKHSSKYGTDDRYPVWKGGAIDPKTINGFTTIATIINWCAIAILFYSPISLDGDHAGPWFPLFYAIAIAICMATMFLIRHPDRSIRWFTRGLASGIPLAYLILSALAAILLT